MGFDCFVRGVSCDFPRSTCLEDDEKCLEFGIWMFGSGSLYTLVLLSLSRARQ
jgi:hypothetical protein